MPASNPREAREAQLLAPFAQKSQNSRGRRYPEPEENWRTPYQRDRDRIIHSRAFRQLGHKTQVFLDSTGGRLRTRLTHTIEVAAIARNLAQALNLNEDLAEAISLAHDLGHAPFSHKGEQTLNQLMSNAGGFEHNRQSLRVIELLEHKHPNFPGLNLTWEVREGLAKHHTACDSPAPNRQFHFPNPSLEAQIANLADEIAYDSHDLDDGIQSGLLSETQLAQNLEIWHQANTQVRNAFPNAPAEPRRHLIIRTIIDCQAKDVVAATLTNIAQTQPQSPDDVRQQPQPLANYSPTLQPAKQQLKNYLFKNLYYHPQVHQPTTQAVQTLEKLFRLYQKSHHHLPKKVQAQIPAQGLQRAICDHIAGMTEHTLYTRALVFGLISLKP